MDVRDAIAEAILAFLRSADPAAPVYASDIHRVVERLMCGAVTIERDPAEPPMRWKTAWDTWCDGWPWERPPPETRH